LSQRADSLESEHSFKLSLINLKLNRTRLVGVATASWEQSS
jgi:hypothetical protein